MRKKNNTLKNNKKTILILSFSSCLLLILLLSSYFSLSNLIDKNVEATSKTPSISDEEDLSDDQLKPSNKTYKITSLGNLIVHDAQLRGAKNGTTYNFDKSFEYISPLLQSSDLSLGIVEGSFSGENFSGYPLFNMPDEFLTSCKNAGLDLITFATNHSIDRGIDGFKRGIMKIKESNMLPIGARSSTSDKKYTVYELDNHKVGFFAYTFKTAANNGESINSIPLSPDLSPLINTFSYNKISEMETEVKEIISSMKAEGVEFIFSSIHWGTEYDTTQNNSQKEIATMLNSNGVDIILGGHPHVIQPYETLTSKSGHKTLAIYSQGNTLSNQCFEEIGISKSEDGLIFDFTLGVKENKLYLKSYDVIPTWVYREPNKNGTMTHRIIPVKEAIESPASFNISNDSISKLNRSLSDTKSILGENKLYSQQSN
ncbi:CapA family protein [uncultured Clostridium sp.]|uniref:CapA family protein n=1 Tax=uncultured Clostridium sp. TaxID=59620 RepID=UPI0026291016|nr:CapA family protein [uncultured Clostridium sp.]